MSKTYYPPVGQSNTFWTEIGQHRQNNNPSNSNLNNNNRPITYSYYNQTPTHSYAVNENKPNTGCVQGQCPVGAFTGGPFTHDNRR